MDPCIIKRCGATPLLFLLDGVLSQDEGRVGQALQEIVLLGCGPPPPSSPCNSRESLCMVLSALLDVYPELASIKSEHDDSLPIHFAASLGSVPVAELIFAKYPQGAEFPNKKGKIALHYAAREGHAAMVDFFLRVAPQTASIATQKGKLAIHFAAGEDHLEIIKSLLRHYPKSAALSTTKGKLPLHFSARWGYLRVSETLLEVFPDGIRALDWEGALPLHDAAREGQVEMVRFLIERFPEALRVANIRSEIPLFPAAQSRNIELVLCMLQSWPAGGKYVLQNVGEDDDIQSWPWDFVELLLRGATQSLTGHPMLQGLPPPKCVLNYDVHPTQFIGEINNMEESKLLERLSDTSMLRHDVETPNREARPIRSRSPVLESIVKDGRKSRKRRISSVSESSESFPEFLAVHAALRCNVSSFVLKRVLAERSSELSQVDAFGRYPLHWAVTNKNPFVRAMMVSQDNGLISETAASVRDVHGKLPLHIAIDQKASVSIIKRLLQAWPKSAISPNHATDAFYMCTPMRMAIMRRCDVSTIFELLRADPTFLQR